jgi:hypothetical protein
MHVLLAPAVELEKLLTFTSKYWQVFMPNKITLMRFSATSSWLSLQEYMLNNSTIDTRALPYGVLDGTYFACGSRWTSVKGKSLRG